MCEKKIGRRKNVCLSTFVRTRVAQQWKVIISQLIRKITIKSKFMDRIDGK